MPLLIRESSSSARRFSSRNTACYCLTPLIVEPGVSGVFHSCNASRAFPNFQKASDMCDRGAAAKYAHRRKVRYQVLEILDARLQSPGGFGGMPLG